MTALLRKAEKINPELECKENKNILKRTKLLIKKVLISNFFLNGLFFYQVL